MRGVRAFLVLTALLAGCSGAGDVAETAAPTSTASPTTQAAATAKIDGLFAVGGHKLHLYCEGSGSPTVVYLHGLDDGFPARASGNSARLLPSQVAATGHRFCGYDRANIGASGKVRGPLNGKTSVADLHGLLRAAKIKPPYVLLGASFGGLIANIYAASYPKEVTGMVLLDAAFPDEVDLERYFPKDERMTHDEWPQLPEQIDPLGVYEDGHALIGKEPAIPVTYLLAMPSTWAGPPAYEKVILGRIAKYVDRYSPGELVEVESDHYMEAAVPARIVQELEKVIAKA
jgi:pimeloyl-ACP methyl ester carboxylesterase